MPMKKKRARMAYSNFQLDMHENAFDAVRYPDPNYLDLLSKNLCVPVEKIQVINLQ